MSLDGSGRGTFDDAGGGNGNIHHRSHSSNSNGSGVVVGAGGAAVLSPSHGGGGSSGGGMLSAILPSGASSHMDYRASPDGPEDEVSGGMAPMGILHPQSRPSFAQGTLRQRVLARAQWCVEVATRVRTVESIQQEMQRAEIADNSQQHAHANPMLSSVDASDNASIAAAAAGLGAAPSGATFTTLRRSLGIPDLIGYGVGSTVGAGIYSLVGAGAATAGPAIVFSFLIGAISCIFTGLAYSEFAVRVPVAGSAYTYAYTCFGEMLAFLIGWNLTLEYAIAAAAIARGWAQYIVFFSSYWGGTTSVDQADPLLISILAGGLILVLGLVMLFGIKIGARMNACMAALNVLVLLTVVFAGSTQVSPSNWTVLNDSFVPYGISSVFSGAGMVFFSYLGFDTVSSLAEETAKPQRDMPLSIIGSLAIASSLYVAISLVVTGMVPFTDIISTSASANAPIVFAFYKTGMFWAINIVAVGALLGLSTSSFTSLLGQPRIFYRMGRDGLLPAWFSKLNSRGVPMLGTLLTSLGTALVAFFFSLESLAEAISVGTLMAFTIVDAGLVVLRQGGAPAHPSRVLRCMICFVASTFLCGLAFTNEWHLSFMISFGLISLVAFVFIAREPLKPVVAAFKCPLVPYIPCAGIVINVFMLAGLGAAAWERVLIWSLFGFLIYALYGARHSKLHVPHMHATEADHELLKWTEAAHA